MSGPRGARSALWQYVGLTLLGTLAVGLCVIALTRDPSPGSRPTSDSPSSSGAVTTENRSSAAAEEPIDVPDQRRADFSAGAPLPEGSQLYDNGRNRPGVGVRQGALRHGKPTDPLAVGSLESQLDAPVQKLGARISFAADHPGSVVLVAWQSSLIAARQAGDPVPPSGLKLVVSPGLWQLMVQDKGEVVIAGDEFPIQPGVQTFEVFREGDHAWVVDPSGARTDVVDPRVGQLAGPWACWQLVEDTPAERPAAIEAVWAG